MQHLAITLVTDGTSDACLIPILDWIMRENCENVAYRVQHARELPPVREGLPMRLQAAVRKYPCDVLIVHRDAERESLEDRLAEIHAATANLATRIVPAIPVRMLEAWLLCDEGAIRSAAGNPNGGAPLGLPGGKPTDRLPDPKKALFEALVRASELSGRRLARFKPESKRHRVAELIEDYSPLRALDAFTDFETAVVLAVA